TFTDNAQGIAFTANAGTCMLSIQNNDLSNNSGRSIDISNGLAGTQMVNNAAIVIDSNQINGGGGDAITISPAGTAISITITNNSISDNLGTGFVSFFNEPGPDVTLLIAHNTIANNQNMASFNASGGISFDGFNSVSALIEEDTF